MYSPMSNVQFPVRLQTSCPLVCFRNMTLKFGAHNYFAHQLEIVSLYTHSIE